MSQLLFWPPSSMWPSKWSKPCSHALFLSVRVKPVRIYKAVRVIKLLVTTSFLACCKHCFYLVPKSCPTLCNPMDCSTPGFPLLHCLPEFAQTHVYWVGNAISPSHPLPPSSPFVFNLSQHQGLFQWVGSLHQVAKVLKLQFQHQSFQWIFRLDFL